MKIEYDADKNATNIAKHGLSLKVFELLDKSQAVSIADNRYDYGEQRVRMFAHLAGRLCVTVFTMRGEVYRIISLRKANKRERDFYDNKIK